MVALAPHLDAFIAALFGVETENRGLARQTHELDPIHACKRLFVQRQAVKKYPDPSGFDGPVLRAALEALFGDALTERRFADQVRPGRRPAMQKRWISRCAMRPGRR